MEELSSNLSPTFLPSMINKFLNKLSSIPSAAARAAGIDEFVRRLEEEMAKIDAFKRELPICMVLLRDVIRILEKESIRNIEIALRSTEPETEEFVLFPKCKDVVNGSKNRDVEAADLAEKKDWMSSAKLWSFGDVHSSSSSSPNPDLDPQVKNDSSDPKNKGKGVLEIKDRSEKPGNAGGGVGFMNLKRHCSFPSSEEKFKGKGVLEIKDWPGKPGNGVGFMPLKRRCTFPSSMNENNVELMTKNPIQEDVIRALSDAALAAQASSKSSNPSLVYNPPSIEQQQGSRKQRRSWGHELHNAFLSALAKLGGEKVATPKQILEVMKVDGLTNSEVKSHLQKYRIYTRKMLNNSASQGNGLGNLWPLNYEYGESSKVSNPWSPEGPLHLVLNSGVTTTSITGGESMEEEEDEKTESHSWKKTLSRNNRH